MSTDDPLTERDAAVLDAATAETDDTDDEAEDDVAALRRTTTSHQLPLARRVREAEEDAEKARETTRALAAKVNKLETAIEGDTSLIGATTLEKYANMDPADRDDVLGTSERRAVEVYLHWDELAWTAQGRRLMETQARANAKNQPSKIRYRLEQFFDESLQGNEIYRLMKAMARLSGGEESTDRHGRLHITGGEYEFHVRPITDGSGTRKVLEEVS